MAGPSKDDILSEIRRCAAENSGIPLGIVRFERATGIRVADWAGKYWARWGDAVNEAGFELNDLTKQKFDDDRLIGLLATLTLQLGRFPTSRELRMQRRTDASFPNEKVFWSRLGSRHEQLTRVVAYATDRADLAVVQEICTTLLDREDEPLEVDMPVAEAKYGYVYLLRVGRDYKIGRANSFERRERELAIQLPERAERVHVIRTDDPVGIERYWHQRFASRRKNGEWFTLTAADVRAFRQRKFM